MVWVGSYYSLFIVAEIFIIPETLGKELTETSNVMKLLWSFNNLCSSNYNEFWYAFSRIHAGENGNLTSTLLGLNSIIRYYVATVCED